jgi:hypothetical protein
MTDDAWTRDDIIVLAFCGALAAFVIGYVTYRIMKQNDVASATSITLTSGAAGSTTNPTGYYSDAVQIPISQQPYTPIVQNDENIKWTDWLGRERIITISRTVH